MRLEAALKNCEEELSELKAERKLMEAEFETERQRSATQAKAIETERDEMLAEQLQDRRYHFECHACDELYPCLYCYV